MISFKEYKAQKEAEQKDLTADKSTPEEEDWDADPPLPPWETPPGAGSMVLSQEDEWKWMIDQDSHSGSITGDLGHGTMTVMKETESMEKTKELTGAIGGVNKSTSAEYLSDIEWREDDPLVVFDDDNITKPQALTTTLTPIQTCKEDTVATLIELPLRKKPCFWETMADQLSKTILKCLKPNYDQKELVGFTRPPLVDVIPWIRYEVQNMVEPSFRQELQCIREIDHLRYIIVMIVWVRCWKQDQGWWLMIPACRFQVRTATTVNIETRVLSVITQVDMSQGESQVLQVLTTLQYLTALKAHHWGTLHIVYSQS